MVGTLIAADEVYHGVAVAPDGMNAWVVTIETTNIYHTTDFGLSWGPQEILTIRDFFDIFFLDSQKGWTCGRIGDIFHTSNGGDDWSRQNLGGPKFATRIQFIDDSLGWCAGGEAILLRTTSGGAEWEMKIFPNPPYPGDTVDFHGVYFSDPDTGWLVAGRYPSGDTFAFGQGYITRTTDGGESWDLVRKDTVYDFYGVAFLDGRTGWVAGGNDQTMGAVVLHTTNSGTDWAELSLPAEARFLRALEFVGDRHGWACGRHGTIIRTTDGGTSWQFYPGLADTTLFDIEFADTLRGMAAGNSVVYLTTDGGNTWVRGMGAVAEPREPVRRDAALLRVSRNPARSNVIFRITGVEGRYGLMVYDATGRSVRRLEGTAPGGEQSIEWDGTDTRAGKVAPGVYLARLTAGDLTRTVRFTWLPASE